MIDSDLTPSSLFSLDGRVAIVTGATSGIGLAAAEALAAAGSRVVLAGLGDAAAAARGLTSRGMAVVGVEIDLLDAAAPAQLVASAVREWGRLDTVFANAGAALDQPGEGAGSEPALGHLQQMFTLHVVSVARLAEVALPVMADAGGGAFTVMSSIAGLRGNRVLSGYGVTKAANAALVRNLAVQWGPRGIRVNALSPGVIDTDFAAPITGDAHAASVRLGKTPLGRFGTPVEVAGAVVWLASRAGAFVSGQNVVIDGGTLIAD